MIITKLVKIKPRGKSITHYKNMGYSPNYMEILEVNPIHLSKYSEIKIDVRCSSCEKNSTMRYCNYFKNTSSLNENYKCKSCKYKNICQEKYGVDNIIQLKETQEKIKLKSIEKYEYHF